jgi:hypothetical protein
MITLAYFIVINTAMNVPQAYGCLLEFVTENVIIAVLTYIAIRREIR